MSIRLHKLVDKAGAVWLPFALNKLKHLATYGGKWASQRFRMPDGAQLSVKTAGDDQTIMIQYFHKYEFFASYKDYAIYPGYGIPRNVAMFTDATPGSFGEFYLLSGRGVLSTRGNSGAALFSNLTQPDTTKGERWSYLPLPVDRSAGIPAQVDFFSDGERNGGYIQTFAWQNQKAWEYTWWHNNSSEVLVLSCLGSGLTKSYSARPQWPSVTAYWYTNGTNGNGAATASNNKPTVWTAQRDYWLTAFDAPPVNRSDDVKELQDQWDVPTTIYSTKFQYTAAFKKNARANWRRSCAQRVKASDSDTYFWYIIATDRYGDFVAYRARDYYPDQYDDIPASYVKQATAPYPGWANKRTGPADSHDYWTFTFNKDGTKATSTPFESVDAYVWAAWETYHYNYFNTTLNRFVLDLPPRCMTPMDGGAGPSTANPFHSTGLIWPAEEQIDEMRTANPTWTIYTRFAVSRQRVYYKNNSDFASQTYCYLDGRFYPVAGPRSEWQSMSGDPNDNESVLVAQDNDADKVPAQIHKVGFIEFGLSITGVTTADPDNFTFSVTLLDSERYTDNKRFYVASGYYATDKRTKGLAGLPPDDTLLTAEIEVYVKEPNKVVSDQAKNYDASKPDDIYRVANVTRYLPSGVCNQVRIVPADGYGQLPTFARTQNALKADEPNCEAMLLSSYKGDIDVFYVVRRRDTQEIVKRFCLAYNVQRAGGLTATAGRVANGGLSGPMHMSCLLFADLRALNFLSATRAMKTGSALGANQNDDYPFPNLAPRYELRINGQDIRTVNFSKPGVADYTATPDPMVDLATPRGTYTKLPMGSAYVAPTGLQQNGTNVPDSFLLACQIWASDTFFLNSLQTHIPTHPAGHWSVYFDPRGAGYTFDETTSTEKSGVFDIIAPGKGPQGSHKAAFNSAFADQAAGRPPREYSYYRENLNEMGGFCTAGIWFDFTEGKT